jgi:hypothetical protein
MSIKIEVQSYKNSKYSSEKMPWRNNAGEVYSRASIVTDFILGRVECRVSKWFKAEGNGLQYTAECSFMGRTFYAIETDVKKGTLSNRSLVRWTRKHAIPAMRKQAMLEIPQ